MIFWYEQYSEWNLSDTAYDINYINDDNNNDNNNNNNNIDNNKNIDNNININDDKIVRIGIVNSKTKSRKIKTQES